MDWVTIIGHPEYQIRVDGSIRRRYRDKWKRSGEWGYLYGHRDEYLIVSLDGKRYKHHRLLAAHFIPNPENKPEINHKNGDKFDNRLENLEWVTRQENHLHAIRTGLCDDAHKRIGEKTKVRMSKLTIDLETGIFYNSLKDAAISIGMNVSTARVLLHKKKPSRLVYA